MPCCAGRRVRPGLSRSDPHPDTGPVSTPQDFFTLARKVLEHFDEYFQGTGYLQRKASLEDPGLSREHLAQRYRVELAGPSADRPHLRIGPLSPAKPAVVIDLVEHAPQAARRLCLALDYGIGGWAPAQSQVVLCLRRRTSPGT